MTAVPLEEISILESEDYEASFDPPSGRFQKVKDFFKPSVMKQNAIDSFFYVAYPRGSPLLTEIKNNVRSGLTVSLVSVPLSISLAIASGATPEMGLVTAFWGGIGAALLGGSHYNVTGPTGALSGLLASAALQYGMETLPLLAILAGIISLVIWAFKLDKYVMFIPSSVIHGFTIGVALIIALNQLNFIFGLTGLPVHETFLENTFESLKNLGDTNIFAVIYFVINLVALLGLSKKWPNFPWAITLSVLGMVVGFLSTKEYLGPIHLETLENRYGDLQFVLVSFPKIGLGDIFNFDLSKMSFGVAFIAILETLISARIADGITKTDHDQRREVMSIGVSNIVSGLAGGIPATAALARTALNIKSGATSRVSAIINCISVLVISFAVLPLFKFIPMSMVGSLLVMVAIRMISTEHLIHMFKFDRTMFWISLISAAFCVAMDTMMGILVGGVLSLLIFTDKMSIGHTEIQLTRGKRVLSHVDIQHLDVKIRKDKKEKKRRKKEKREKIALRDLPQRQPLTSFPERRIPNEDVLEVEEFEDTLVYRFSGQLTYINAIPHLQRIQSFVDEVRIKHVILSLRYVWYIDLDGIDSLRTAIQILKSHQMHVLLSGIRNGNVKDMLSRHKFIQEAIENGTVFPSYVEALDHILGVESDVSEGEITEE